MICKICKACQKEDEISGGYCYQCNKEIEKDWIVFDYEKAKLELTKKYSFSGFKDAKPMFFETDKFHEFLYAIAEKHNNAHLVAEVACNPFKYIKDFVEFASK